MVRQTGRHTQRQVGGQKDKYLHTYASGNENQIVQQPGGKSRKTFNTFNIWNEKDFERKLHFKLKDCVQRKEYVNNVVMTYYSGHFTMCTNVTSL